MLDRRLVEKLAAERAIDEGLIEKDWHVVQALGVIAAMNHGGAVPAFSGGTSLSKGWGLIECFSEDIDFKVAMPAAASRAQEGRERSSFRDKILKSLAGAGFEQLGKPLVGNSSLFFSVDLAYPAQFGAVQGFRPHIKLEMTLRPALLASIDRPISSLIAEAQNSPAEVPSLACVDPIETAADKLSALAWRVYTRKRGTQDDDPTVVRHIHDLAALEARAMGAPGFADLARRVADADSVRAGNEVPPDIAARLEGMLDRLRGDALWAKEYADFVPQVSFAAPDEMITFEQGLAACERLVKAAIENR